MGIQIIPEYSELKFSQERPNLFFWDCKTRHEVQEPEIWDQSDAISALKSCWAIFLKHFCAKAVRLASEISSFPIHALPPFLDPHSKQIVLTDKGRIMVKRFVRQQD